MNANIEEKKHIMKLYYQFMTFDAIYHVYYITFHDEAGYLTRYGVMEKQ